MKISFRIRNWYKLKKVEDTIGKYICIGPILIEWAFVENDTRVFVGYPSHWPKKYNANSEPCDMLDGPCSCGAWHDIDDNWSQSMIISYGTENPNDSLANPL